MDLLDINESQIKALSKVGMSISHFWLLHLLYNSEVVVRIPQIRERKLLEDRGLIDKKSILLAGKVFYEQIVDTQLELSPEGKKKVDEVVDNGFVEVWSIYPSSANFTYRGMQFRSDRALKGNKKVCEMLYNAAIASGEITKDKLIAAIKYQVEEAKKQSFETGQNRLQFLPGFEPYLRQAKYCAFLDVVEEGIEDNSDNPQDNCAWA